VGAYNRNAYERAQKYGGGLSYINKKLDTDTRGGGREVKEEMRRLCCKGGMSGHDTTGVLTKGQRRKKRLCSDGNISKDGNSDGTGNGNCRFTLIMK
jgi:hypothetical protein